MPTQATWNALSGSWFSAGNWDEPNPAPPPAPPIIHYVPGADNDVSIPNNSGLNPPTPFTVTYNGTSTINTLAGEASGTLDITGGSLTLLNGGQYNSMKINVGGGTALSVMAGTLITTAGSFAGTVSGTGRVTFVGGDFAINAGASFTIAEWVLGVTSNGVGSKTTLNTDLTYANDFTLADYSGNASILKLNGHTLTLSGTALFDGQVQGPGTLSVTGTAQSGTGYGQLSVINGATLNIGSGGSLAQHHNVLLGNAGTTGTLTVDAGGSYTIDATYTLGGSTVANSLITNNGTLRADGSAISATIAGQLTSNGTLEATAGNRMVFGGGGTYTLGGTLQGAGKMVVGPGSATLNSTSVTVARLALDGGNVGSTLTLGTDLTYGGIFSFDFLFDTLQLNGHTLTLSGTGSTLNGNQVNGTGTLKVTGSASIGGNLSLGTSYGDWYPAALQNAGAISQTGNVGLNGTLQNDAGRTYTITAASTLSSRGTNGATVLNNGTIAVNGAGNTTINGALTNNGTLAIASGATLIADYGTKALNGTVSGAGTLLLGGGANATLNTSTLSVAAITLAGGNVGAKLKLGKSLIYGGVFSFANQFDTVDLNGYTLTLSGTSNSLISNQVNGAGTLKITGAATIGGNAGFGRTYGTWVPMTLRNSGAISQDGSISLNGTLLNDAGKTYTIIGAGDISSVGTGATVTNNGTFMVNSVGASRVSGTFTNSASAVLHVASGSTLTLDGGTETLNGTVKGLGTLRIGGGGVATLDASTVSVANLGLAGGNVGAQLILGRDLVYAGVLSFVSQFDTLRLNGYTLTLSGSGNSLLSSNINGAGTLRITGSATIGSFLSLGSGAGGATPMTLRNSGSVTQTGSLTLNGTILNDAGKTYTIGTAGSLYESGPGGTFTNNGTLTDTGTGTSEIYADLASTGTLSVASGAVLQLRGTSNALAGSVSGAGALVLVGNTSLDPTTLSIGALTVGGGTTTLARTIGYSGSFALAQAFAVLAINGHTLTLTGPTAFTAGTISGLDGAVDTLAITGAAVDLSAVGFASWEAGDVITITGTSAANTLVGSSLRDTINGGDDADTLVGRGGADALIGGMGTDTASYAGGSVAVRADLSTGAGTGGDAQGDTYSSIENLVGTDLADTLIGSSAANRLEGGKGDDVLAGRGGADQLIGGDGIDTVSYGTSAAAVRVDLSTGIGTGSDAEGDTYSSIENIRGSSFADTLIGSAAANIVEGGDGDDVLAGRGGADQLIGGSGSDTVSYGTSAAAVRVDLIKGIGTGSDAEGDTYSSIENIRGSNLADTLIGSAAANIIEGGNGDDVLAGRGGADQLIGGSGSDTVSYGTSAAGVSINLSTGATSGGDATGDTFSSIENVNGSGVADTLVGSSGANRLDGGLGSDTLTGGGGGDTFLFTTAPSTSNVDTITDMTVGSDLISLATAIYSALQAGPTPGSLAASSFRYSTQASTSGGLGEIIYNATTGSLSYDADGSGAGAAKQFAQVSTALALSASSFRLA